MIRDSSFTFRLRRPLWFIYALLFGFAAVSHAQQTTAAPKPPPIPNRVNELLPQWLRIRGEFRERVEGFEGLGFVDGRDDTYWLSRFRLSATVTATPLLAFQVQAQDARVGDKQVGTVGPPFKGPFDLRMAFADIGTTSSRFFSRVGRQELSFGDQRLVGHLSWTNTARTFDGASVTVRAKKAQVAVFGASLVRSLDGEFDKSGNGNSFFGAYAATTALVPKASVEPYVFVKNDRNITQELGGLASLTSTTIGGRVAGKLPARLDYITEMAAQTGSVGNDSISAWAGHWRVRHALPGGNPLRIIGEFNAASGDSSPADGRRETFDQLYPTGHDKYGLADQVGWRNIRHARTGVELPAIWKVQPSASYHTWWLMERGDALYSASGAVLARVPGGAASTHVGHEIDVQAIRVLTAQVQIAAGYAHIIPGSFLKEATPGASYSAPYLMVTYVFLADK